MHALVTGGGGFLGGYIVEALRARGDKVRSFGRKLYPNLAAKGVEVVRGDLRDGIALAAACDGIECVFHAAAQPGIGLDRDLYEGVNRTGTEMLLSAARKAGAARFIYTSSPSVVFAGVDQRDVNESAPYDFGWMEEKRAYYSHTKASAEQAVLAANCSAFRTCSLRPHLIWGPGDTHLIPRLLARARAGRLRRVGDGANLVDITYVENAAAAHLQAADAMCRTTEPAAKRSGEERAEPTDLPAEFVDTLPPCGRAYFISQGEPVNCWQWIDEILALVNLPPVRKTISQRSAARIGAACETVYGLLGSQQEPPMTRFLAAQLSTSHWFNISAAARDFGFRPRVSTAEGMQRLGEWLRQRNGAS